MIDRYGYAKARKIGVVAMIGGKDKQAKRNRSPLPFRSPSALAFRRNTPGSP